MSGSSHEGGDRLIGQVIADRYQILELLGEGGMGRVYLAEHVRMGRKSAIKVLSPNLALSADAISRFNREAANASRINHPNVAQIYDFGETSDGLLYLAMEYVEGETLRALIGRTGPLPLDRAADITKQAADALAAAHHLGIVHRDLKPDNIMIARHHDGSDWVKVVDFGIAKTVQGSGDTGGSQTLTTAGVSLGTPEYMSPEQLAGEKLDNRTDLYSLGLVLFNMLTGDLPYPKVTSRDTLVRRLTAKPHTLAEVAPGTPWPPALQAALDNALASEAADRYESVTEFARDVRATAGDSATRRLGGAATVRLGVPARVGAAAARTKRSVLTTAAAVLLVVAVGAGALVASFGRRATSKAPPARGVGSSSAAVTAMPPTPVAAPAAKPAPRGIPQAPAVPEGPTVKQAAVVAKTDSTPAPRAVDTSRAPVPAVPPAPAAQDFAAAASRRHGGFGRGWLGANGDTARSAAAAPAPATDADRIRLLANEIRGHFIRANQSLQRADVQHLRSELRDVTSDARTLTELYPTAAESLHVQQFVSAATRRLAERTCPAAMADTSKHFPARFSCEQLLPNFARTRQGQSAPARPPLY